MRNPRINLQGAAFLQKLSRGSQCTRRLGKIVDQEHVVVFHLPDQVQCLSLGGAASFLCHDCQICAECFCVRRGHFESTEVRRNHHRFSSELLSQIFNQPREGIEVIDGNVEETLHLLCMEVHRQHAAYASGMQQVRDEFRRNRHAWLVLTVLTRVSKKRNNRRDPIRTGAPRGVHHDEQLHQVFVSRRAGRLNDENIMAANVFLDLDVRLAIGKRTDCCLTEWYPDVFANALGQLAVGGAAENLQFWLERKHWGRGGKLGVRDRHWQSSKLANNHFFRE